MKQYKSDLLLKVNLYTIIAVYVLILVGGIVRTTGAGMGCPDWPKCFGQYIPPTSEDQLPDDYEDLYLAKRVQKNQRLSNLLNSIGFESMAARISADRNATAHTFFEPTKAWIEYVNRLVGVVIGFLILANCFFSFKVKRLKVRIFGSINLLLVLFQGWIGSLVVSTNLIPGFISFHMFLALLQIYLLMVHRNAILGQDREVITIKAKWVLILSSFLFLIQILFGTQVREQVDQLKLLGISRENWVENFNIIFYIHRSYSILLITLIGVFVFKNIRLLKDMLVFKALVLSVVFEILLGVLMIYVDFPKFAQPMHLLLGILSFGFLINILMRSDSRVIVD